MNEHTMPAGIVEIAYDNTPAPGPDRLAAAAAELELPALDWQVIRRIRGRVVALGRGPEASEPSWVMKIASNAESVNFLAHGAAWATTLAGLAAGQRLIVAPEASRWRLVVNDLGTRAALAAPFVEGLPLAPEIRLDAAGVAALRAEIPTILSVMTALAQLSYTPIRPRLKEWEAHLRRRFERHLLALLAAGQFEEPLANQLRSAFRHYLGQASSAFRLAHGELTPWHILRTPDGRLAMIDLDTMGYEIRHLDLTVLVMRIWALEGAPEVAEELRLAYLASLTPRDREAFGRTTSWQWLFAGVRALHEAQSWPDATAAREFLAWCQEQQV